MKSIINKLVSWVAISVLAVASLVVFNTSRVMADSSSFGITMSPMHQNVILDPGDSREVSFKISNPSASTESLNYEISVDPFYIENNGETVFEEVGDHNKIVDWISFDVPTKGSVAPNETKEISFTVNVPASAPAGGQYASIFLTTSGDSRSSGNSTPSNGGTQLDIEEIKKVGHLLYAEVTGNTIKKGEISDVNVPSFLLSGNITASSMIKNNGNVHGQAKYTLQVYPLFSSEEIYTNEESPKTHLVMPDRTLYDELTWEETPDIGIFNVKYTVEFEGETAEVSKMVIKCPVWLLFIILFVIALIIIWVVLKVKNRHKSTSRDSASTKES